MQCVTLSADNVVSNINADLTNCTQYVLMTASDYNSYSDASFYQLLSDLFVFDLAVFSLITGTGLVMFLVSYGGGSVVRWLGRS